MATTMTTDNKRVAARQRVMKAAKIISMDRSTIMVENQSVVPREFYFFQVKDNQMCSAKVVWRRENLVGIHFTSDMGPPPASLNSLRR
jgi:hypothetical protein